MGVLARQQGFWSPTFTTVVTLRGSSQEEASPGDLVAAGHGEQPLALQHAVPRLDCVAGPDRDGSLPGLDLGPELPPGLAVGMSVSLV